MKITEKQICQLILHCKTFQTYLMHGEEEITHQQEIMYEIIENLIGEIYLQQSEELKDIE